jgi:hypothetical protein
VLQEEKETAPLLALGREGVGMVANTTVEATDVTTMRRSFDDRQWSALLFSERRCWFLDLRCATLNVGVLRSRLTTQLVAPAMKVCMNSRRPPSTGEVVTRQPAVFLTG